MAMTDLAPLTLEERLRAVQLQVTKAAQRAGRDPEGVTVIAVSKGFAVDSLQNAHAVGQRDFGENRVGELMEKHRELPPSVRWHFIGRLQRNKVGRVVQMNPVIHSIDSRELAEQINRRAETKIEALVEVNVSGEPQKAGVIPDELPKLVEAVLGLERVELTGLMTMAPRSEDPERARALFRRLAEMRYEVAERYSCPRIHHLSMGMSQDYLVAVEEGSTMVRIGEAIFGPRAPARRAGVLER